MFLPKIRKILNTSCKSFSYYCCSFKI